MALQDLTMMPLSRLDCPLSLETANMGNPGLILPSAARGSQPLKIVITPERWERPSRLSSYGLNVKNDRTIACPPSASS